MATLTPENLPSEFTPEILDELVRMGMVFPQTAEWHAMADHLHTINKFHLVLDKIRDIQHEEYVRKENMKSPEQKAAEAAAIKKRSEDPTPRFIGNMGEPETLEQYKNKYGAYPPGYDKFGNRE